MENLQDTLDALRAKGQLSSQNPVVMSSRKRKSKGCTPVLSNRPKIKFHPDLIGF
ncbi:MAG: hypothetical protein IPL78_30170 [Chloroflexi bacterium]|nr:hypothetical protein [Chloroflexota bacterium]